MRRRRVTAWALAAAALVALAPAHAQPAAATSAAATREAADVAGAMASRLDAADAALEAGDIGRARTFLHEARDPGVQGTPAALLLRLAALLEEIGEARVGQALLREALDEGTQGTSQPFGQGLAAARVTPRSAEERLALERGLGEAELALGEVDAARGHLERAYGGLVAALPDDAPERLAATHALSRLRNVEGRPAEAIALAQTAVSDRTQRLGATAKPTLQSRRALAVARLGAGDAAGAADALRDVLAVQEASNDAGRRDTLATRAAYASALSAVGEGNAALEQFRAVHAALRALFGPEHPDVVLAAGNVAAQANTLGFAREALAIADVTLPVGARVLAPDDPDVLALADVRAVALANLGRLDEALAAEEDVRARSIAKLGPDHPDSLLRLRNLASLYDALGRTEEALALLAEVARRRTATRGADDPDTLEAVTAHADLLHTLGRLDEARALLERVLPLEEAKLGARHPFTLTTMDALANVELDLGDDAKARALAARASSLMREALGERHRWTLHGLATRARIETAAGRPAQGIAFAQAARAGFAGGEEARSYLALDALLALIDAQVAARDRRGARASLRTLVGDVEALRSGPQLSPENRQALLARAAPGYKRLALAEAQDGRPADGFRMAELAKGRTLLEALTTRRADASALLPAADRERLAELAVRADRLAESIAAADSAQRRASLEAERNAALRSWAQARAELLARFPRYARLAEVRLIGVAEGAALLPRNAVFVSFVVTPERIAAFTLDARGPPALHDLGPVRGLEGTVDAWRQAVTGTGVPVWRLPDGNFVAGLARPSGARKAKDADEIGRALARRLLLPMRRALGTGRWIVAPDGPLAFLPFEALPWNGRPVVAGKVVSYTQSLSTYALVREREAQQRAGDDRRALLAIGAPDYSVATGRPRWAPLPGAQREIAAVTALFAPGDAEIRTGLAASEAGLLELNRSGRLAQFRYVLFSTHGRLSLDAPAQSAIVLEQRDNPPGIDGYVTAAEWPLYDLASDLVVLSGCETGLGRLLQGEGVTGLPYALYLAGARNAMLSLWAVDDAATATLIADAFRQVVAGRDHAEALALAKRALLARDPRTPAAAWAPFVLYGS